MRLVVVGKTSFLAGHIVAAAKAQGLDTLLAGHADDLPVALRGAQAVVNCALVPDFRTTPYRASDDFDLAVARQAHAAGAIFTMLSTRRVYAAPLRWSAAENAQADGDETVYGRNKARSEAAVRAATHDACAIFRLANIFSLERDDRRNSFMGALLASLRREGVIRFDMDPATRRDFLPVELAAQVIMQQVARSVRGTFNLGSGVPVTCGDMAAWVMEGFGGGRLDAQGPVRDEFVLDMTRTRAQFALDVDIAMLRARCTAIGRELACEKS